jgi:pimeloyl-ACP methyl ester carboxylesterase
VKKYKLSLITFILIGFFLGNSSVYAAEAPVQIKELNFVFLHGANGNPGAMQLLFDTINDDLPAFTWDYEINHPGVQILTDSMNRYYPNNVDLNTWANNIADSINNHFHQDNLILIGHSMGGKAALYAVAHNIGQISDKVAMVITINSPVKNLSRYYLPGGADYWYAQWLVPKSLDQGVLYSLANVDNSKDGNWIGTNKHWLAFCSAESSPTSKQYDFSNVDPAPRDMDDGLVPISAQYADGADVVYYGEHFHSEFESQPEVNGYIANTILRYIFGGDIDYSSLTGEGTFAHKAGWFPVANKWNDVMGEVPATQGAIIHKNESFFKWQEWEDVVGAQNGTRSSFDTEVHSLPLISGLLETRWFTNDAADGRLYIHTRAAPRTSVRVDWSVAGYRKEPGIVRDHYEIEISTGTPFTEISQASWLSTEPGDFRLQVRSLAQGPLRWFEAKWRVYSKEFRNQEIIKEMPFVAASP